MSKENVRGFEELLQNTPDLLEEIKTLGDNLEGIVALAQQNGYEFSVTELQAYLMEKQSGLQLNDAELEQVAGGDGPPLPPGTLGCTPPPTIVSSGGAAGGCTR